MARLNWAKYAEYRRLKKDRERENSPRRRSVPHYLSGWHSAPDNAATAIYRSTEAYKHQDPGDDGIPPW